MGFIFSIEEAGLGMEKESELFAEIVNYINNGLILGRNSSKIRP